MQSITVDYALSITQTQFSVCVSSHQLLFNFIEFYTGCATIARTVFDAITKNFECVNIISMTTKV